VTDPRDADGARVNRLLDRAKPPMLGIVVDVYVARPASAFVRWDDGSSTVEKLGDLLHEPIEGCVICDNEGAHGFDREHVMEGQE
jgi:hypothetical protein